MVIDESFMRMKLACEMTILRNHEAGEVRECLLFMFRHYLKQIPQLTRNRNMAETVEDAQIVMDEAVKLRDKCTNVLEAGKQLNANNPTLYNELYNEYVQLNREIQ